ncbi:hypothetical protein ACWT_3344 [Actinoplanes sp. SE50]|uniref:hypothetical protein n=1 Tax=unclassified Actinoplanes TaxID=2626549 RepID=UPI00023ED065|nr:MULTISPECIES: hypothetical protein [unclassified Actinoplanes]AEV84367.1 hypothetical protein ACPL_3472 [Actinoplanes sp. SE50/110]ATO82759.1 hypothetical protein ACWT_3344 [Actinoplanes sp. SE50]SLM00166.1 hypothetical protein ACSP50_3398 [Actinoplanes sp. SE50/110]
MFDINRRRSGRAGRARRWAVPVAAAAVILAAGGGLVAKAASAAEAGGRGPDEFGMTMGSHAGHSSGFTYHHGFYCDTHIAAASTTGCEAGVAAEVAPARHFDPLFITVPLGFTVKGLDCPDKLTCVDHPMSLDMTRLAPALDPVYKATPEKLMPALRDFTTPGHDHFIGTRNGGKAEWWDVRVVGVTDPATYRAIRKHQSWTYLDGQIKAKNKHLVGPIPTNMFLFFAAH